MRRRFSFGFAAVPVEPDRGADRRWLLARSRAPAEAPSRRFLHLVDDPTFAEPADDVEAARSYLRFAGARLTPPA